MQQNMSYDAPTLEEFLAGFEIAVPVEQDSEGAYGLIAYRYYRATGRFHMRDLTLGGIRMSADAFTEEQAARFYLYVVPAPGKLS